MNFRNLLLLLLFARPLMAEPTDVQSDELEQILQEMGYIDVAVSGCRISFSRTFNSDCPSQFLSRTDRTVHLDTLVISSVSDVTLVDSQSGIYAFNFQTNHPYVRDNLIDYFRFSR